MGRHKALMFSWLTFLLSLLNAFSTSSNNRNSLFSSWKLFLAECILLLPCMIPIQHTCLLSIVFLLHKWCFPFTILWLLLYQWFIISIDQHLYIGLMPLSFFFNGSSLHVKISFLHWTLFHLELYFQRWLSLFFFQGYKLWQIVLFPLILNVFFAAFMSQVMSYFLSMSLAVSTNLKAFFAYSISLQKAFWFDCFWLICWVMFE